MALRSIWIALVVTVAVLKPSWAVEENDSPPSLEPENHELSAAQELAITPSHYVFRSDGPTGTEESELNRANAGKLADRCEPALLCE
jgi:hypothetical protein